MKPSMKSFGCFIIGEGSLPVRCAEILLEKGHRIHGAVCTEPTLRSWARAHAIPEVDGVPAEQPFEYLFSIVNYRVLSKDELALPSRLAINYHDGPLPRYAGSHSTSWALMSGERSHAVTWHVMTSL